MKLLHLDKNEYVYPHSPKVIEYLKNINVDILSYYSSSTDPLIYKIAEKFNLPIENIVLAHGGESLLKEAIASIVESGDTVLLPDVGWAYYSELIKEVSGNIVYYPSIISSSQYEYDIPVIIQLLRQHKPKLILLASPNNPTGQILTKGQCIEILQAAEENDCHIILDEAYIGFSKNSFSWEDISKFSKILSIRSFSKYYGLIGIRMGYGFISSGWDNLKQKLYRYLGFSPLCSDIALKGLESHDFYENNVKKIVIERENLEKSLYSLGFTVFTSQANFVFFKMHPDQFEKAQKIFNQSPIRIKFFNAQKEPLFSNSVRITVGLPEHNKDVLNLFNQVRD